MIKVEYDGKYPSACMGTLKVIENGEVVYNEKYRCHSTGNCWIDDAGDWCTEDGKLQWEDAHLFSHEIQRAVSKCLSKYYVCCGGCI